MSSPRTAATESCPVEQPYRNPVGGRVFYSIAARRRIKRAVMWLHGYLWLPDFIVAAAFRLFRLRRL